MAERNDKHIEEFEKRLVMLRTTFDLYFSGLERIPPVDELDKMKKLGLRLKSESGRWSTADKFRMRAVYQKFTSYQRMWDRQMKEVEAGTHRRDRMKVKRRRAQEQEQIEAAKAYAEGTLIPKAAETASASSSRPAKAAGGGGGGGTGGMSEDKMRRLYSVYMQAKKRTGENSNLSFESLAAQLRKQVPAIRAKHKCQNVDFKVVLKNGKAMLKAVPK